MAAMIDQSCPAFGSGMERATGTGTAIWSPFGGQVDWSPCSLVPRFGCDGAICMKNRQDANTFDFRWRITDYFGVPLALCLSQFCEIAAFHISFEYFTRMFFAGCLFGCGRWWWRWWCWWWRWLWAMLSDNLLWCCWMAAKQNLISNRA